MVSAIVAVDNNWGIGYNGKLLERIPEDLKYFKELTNNNVIVMGRKTWNSLPVNPLPNRTNIIITRNPIHFTTINGAFRQSLEHTVKDMVAMKNDFNWFVIGGGQIYKELLPLCDRVYVTKIFKDHENVDTYFPNLDESNEWSPAFCGPIQTYNDLSYQFWEYDRNS